MPDEMSRLLLSIVRGFLRTKTRTRWASVKGCGAVGVPPLSPGEAPEDALFLFALLLPLGVVVARMARLRGPVVGLVIAVSSPHAGWLRLAGVSSAAR